MLADVRYKTDHGVDLPRLETAKFTRSRLPPSAVVRPRLIRVLNAFVESPLILVCAPAGFGKSTIVSQWLTQVDVPSAWIALDESDNDPLEFLMVVVAGISKASNLPMAETKQLLESPPAPSHVVLESLFKEMTTWDTRFMLVLDDYQRIQTPALDSLLQFMLENAPTLLSVIVVSRVAPNLSFGRLQAFDGEAFLQEGDLLFTSEEAHEFLKRHLAPDLAPDRVDRLVGAAHGWAVALKLLAVTVNRNPAELDALVSDAYIDESVAKYLIAEVVSRQEVEIQTFLFQTSVFEVLSPSLCDGLTGGHNAAEMLELLSHNNHFTTAIDRRGLLFRYHPLFREALQEHYERVHTPEELQALHVRASALLEEEGLIEWAADHAIRAEDWHRALRLVHVLVEKWCFEDRLPLILQWTTRIPTEELLSDLALCYWHAWATVRLGGVREAQQIVSLVRAQMSENASPLSRGRFDLIQSYILLAFGDWRLGIKLAEQAQSAVANENDHDHAVSLLVLSLLHLASGHPDRARKTADAARDLIERSQTQIWMRCTELTLQGRIAFAKTQMSAAIAIYEHAIALGERSTPQVVQYAHIMLAQAALQILDLDLASSHVDECLRLSESLENHIHISPSLLIRAEVAAIKGDSAAAQRHFLEAIEAAERRNITFQARHAKARQAQFWLDQNRYDLARHWAGGIDVRERHVGDPYRFPEDAVSIRVLIASGATTDALSQVDQLLELAAEQGRLRDRIELLVLRAAVQQARGNNLDAAKDLREGLSGAATDSILLPFVKHGNCIRPVLLGLQSDGMVGKFVRRVVEEVDRATGRVTGQDLVAALTPRELQILECISQGKSNREVAEKLFISETTVKKHLNHVYEKLSVRSRTQAVAYFRDIVQSS